MSLKVNDPEYNVISNRELSSVLMYFTPEMVNDTVDNILSDRIRNHSPIIGNLVESYETNFKIAMEQYPDINRELSEQRDIVYTTILIKICKYHDLICDLGQSDNIYTAALLTYKFLISDFHYNIISFFTNFINNEYMNLYENLKMEELRKNKDSATNYSKKIYNGLDPRLATIHANLDFVLTQICGFDISLEQYIRTANMFSNPQEIDYLCSILKDCGDFFKSHIVPVVMGYNKPEIITSIRLAIQPTQVDRYEKYFITGGSIDE